MSSFIDPQHPFYRPLWRRVAIVALCLGWGVYEFVSGSPFWGVLFVALGLFCAWQFFVAFADKEGDRP
jgi:hypothetical protein